MTDEIHPEDAGSTAATAPELSPDNKETGTDNKETIADEAGKKLRQDVEIKDVGPCKKHIKVTVDRADIDARFGDKFKELMSEATVPGFRPGKAPRKLVERRFHNEVGDQVKSEILLASLEQLAEDHDIAPLSAPNINPAKIEMPKQGPMTYEFDVEVRPHFDLPEYKGLKLKRPVHTFSEEEVIGEERRLLAPYGQVVPKPDSGNAQIGDVLVADVVVREGDRVLGTLNEQQFNVDKQLAFKDGVAYKFAKQIEGANAGDKREVDVTLSSSAADPNLRGKTVKATFDIKDVKTLRLPELTHEFLHHFGVHNPEQLRELIGVLLRRRLEYQQRQSARQQVMERIAAASSWELPEDLLLRQARKAMARRVMEMRSNGISEKEIASRQRLLQQDVLNSTALALKEHFVLQKIAEVEKIDVDDDDLNEEIDRLAEQNNESPRRFRARLEREDLLEALAAEMIERKSLDLILDSAEYEDVPLDAEEEPAVSTVEAQAVPGEMKEPGADLPATEASASETPANPA